MSDSTPAAAADQEVLITRIVEAPRERVFRAWTDPDEVAAWYPAGRGHAEAGWSAAFDKLAVLVAG
jgi:uncharacterized protein YndB with AHSA1/START domain